MDARAMQLNRDVCKDWVAVQELKLSYHNPETILFTIYPDFGSLN